MFFQTWKSSDLKINFLSRPTVTSVDNNKNIIIRDIAHKMCSARNDVCSHFQIIFLAPCVLQVILAIVVFGNVTKSFIKHVVMYRCMRICLQGNTFKQMFKLMWYEWTQWDKKYGKRFQEMPEWECFPLEINRWQVYDLNVLKSTVLLGNPWEIMRNHSLTFNCPVSTIATAFSQPCLPSGQRKNISMLL